MTGGAGYLLVRREKMGGELGLHDMAALSAELIGFHVLNGAIGELASDDHGESGHRKPTHLSRRSAHGNQSVLRTELPCHEARVHRPSSPAAPTSSLLHLSYRARCDRMACVKDGRNPPACRSDTQ